MHRDTRSGFTLVELAIGMAILGLLIGGIMGGQAMVHTTRVRSIGTDLKQYEGAINGFQSRFRAWPGDMTNATSYWGTASGGCPDGARSGTQTCNGDGNQQVGMYEGYWTWQHLANAGLIKGSYSGIAGPGGDYHHVVGVNCPASRIERAGYALYFDSSYVGFGYIDTNILFFGTEQPTSLPNGGALSAPDAYSIDLKLDDGKPATGRIQQYNATTRPGCSSSDSAATAMYQVSSSTDKVCPLLMKIGGQ